VVGRFLGPATYVILGALALATAVWVWRRRRGQADD